MRRDQEEASTGGGRVAGWHAELRNLASLGYYPSKHSYGIDTKNRLEKAEGDLNNFEPGYEEQTNAFRAEVLVLAHNVSLAKACLGNPKVRDPLKDNDKTKEALNIEQGSTLYETKEARILIDIFENIKTINRWVHQTAGEAEKQRVKRNEDEERNNGHQRQIDEWNRQGIQRA